MSHDEFGLEEYRFEEGRLDDPVQSKARDTLLEFFDHNWGQVFFSRQLEVRNEDTYFHWLTNRAMRDLRADGVLIGEKRRLKTGGEINVVLA